MLRVVGELPRLRRLGFMGFGILGFRVWDFRAYRV